jgi:hypothetical protein
MKRTLRQNAGALGVRVATGALSSRGADGFHGREIGCLIRGLEASPCEGSSAHRPPSTAVSAGSEKQQRARVQ